MQQIAHYEAISNFWVVEKTSLKAIIHQNQDVKSFNAVPIHV